MVRKRITTHAALEETSRIRIFAKRTEVEYPVILAVSVIQKFLGMLSAVSVDALNSGRRKTHDDNLVGHVNEVKLEIQLFVLESGLVPRDNPTHEVGHIASCCASRPVVLFVRYYPTSTVVHCRRGKSDNVELN